jgi:hypothetical protein
MEHALRAQVTVGPQRRREPGRQRNESMPPALWRRHLLFQFASTYAHLPFVEIHVIPLECHDLAAP